MFDTKVAIVVLDDLAVWQKLNVTAFLATGIAGAAPEPMGEPHEDAAGRLHARLLGQPMLVFAAGADGLARAWRVAIERELTRAGYVRAMFETGHDAANRAAFKAEPADAPDLVGVAIRGATRTWTGRRRGCGCTGETRLCCQWGSALATTRPTTAGRLESGIVCDGQGRPAA